MVSLGHNELKKFNPYAEFITGSIKTYLNFLSFSDAELLLVVENIYIIILHYLESEFHSGQSMVEDWKGLVKTRD